MKTKRVDIIIPVYNVEPYLRRCLNSVLKQTFKHWRAICVDDGSTDRTEELINSFIKEGKLEIRYLKKENEFIIN